MNEKEFSTKISLDTKDVISFYESYAPFWDARFGKSCYSTNYFLSSRFNSFEKLLSNNSNSQELIAAELGVGTGIYLEKTTKLFKKVLAIDGSSSMIHELTKKVHSQKIKNVQTILCDVTDQIPVTSGSVDIVYFFGLFEHIIELDKFLKNIKSILKKDGVVIGVTPNGLSPWYAIRKYFRGTSKHCTTDKYYRLQEIKEFFEKNGFKFDEALYWGAVPAGIKNRFIVLSLVVLEFMIKKTPLRIYLGGLSFKFRKCHDDF